jgi:hypothetical protein
MTALTRQMSAREGCVLPGSRVRAHVHHGRPCPIYRLRQSPRTRPRLGAKGGIARVPHQWTGLNHVTHLKEPGLVLSVKHIEGG